MRTTQITIVCLTLGLVLAAAPAFGEAEAPSNSRYASCLIRVAIDADILPLDPTTVEQLIRSSAVAGKAAKDVFGLDAEAAGNILQEIRVEWLSQAAQGAGMPEPPQRNATGDSEIMRELAHIYGDDYARQLREDRDKFGTQEPAAVTAPADDNPPVGANDHLPQQGMGMGHGMGGYGGMGGATMGGGRREMTRGMAMGGYGGGIYGGWVPQAQDAGSVGRQQIAMVRLYVPLPDDAKPLAGQFVKAIVDNLRRALEDSYNRYERLLSEQIQFAESRRQEIEQQLGRSAASSSPESRRIREQLSTIVDVSAMTSEMPFSEAIELLKHAVEPPLPIVVLWKELMDSCGIEPTTPIDMDGPSSIKLETALKMVIAAVNGGNSDISYQIDDDVIVIREEELQTPPASITLSSQEDTQELIARRRNLSDAIRDLEMQMAGMEARRQAIEEQIARTMDEADRKLAQDTVTKEFQTLIQMMEMRLSQLRKQVDAGQLPQSELAPAQENLTRARIELAKRQEELRKDAGGGRLDSLNSELSQMAIQTAEQEARLEVFRTQLDETQRRLARVSAFDPQAARLRTARQALNIAERQIMELTNRLVRLQRPSVTLMAADGL
ncbi:MAG TPA: hypothetical protein PLU87_09355 [Sedimentisphaerales bacterium]|nr:hypothetical protein [Sedimentisphaerales bacterium]HRS11325.1 hypothetical protein [Sedimentisphaerales bacterium]HRV47897.1 hypothetical protein [Sedimentisphaerales bacterium]